MGLSPTSPDRPPGPPDREGLSVSSSAHNHTHLDVLLEMPALRRPEGSIGGTCSSNGLSAPPMWAPTCRLTPELYLLLMLSWDLKHVAMVLTMLCTERARHHEATDWPDRALQWSKHITPCYLRLILQKGASPRAKMRVERESHGEGAEVSAVL